MHAYRLVKFKNSPNWFLVWWEEKADTQGPTKRVRRRASTGTSSKSVAQIFMKEFIREAANEAVSDAGVATALDLYYAHHASKLPSANQAKHAIANLKSYFGYERVETCTIARQRGYIEKRQAENCKPGYINRELAVLSAAFNWVVDYEKIAGLKTCPKVKFLPAPPPKDVWMTKLQIARLFWHLRRVDRGYPIPFDPKKPSTDKRSMIMRYRVSHIILFMRLGLYSGPRPHEITGLQWDRDIDFQNRMIHYYNPEEHDENKRASAVGMTDYIHRALKAAHRAAKARCKPGQRPVYVIEYNGKPVDRVIRAMKKHSQAVGILKLTPHVLRHTFATWAIQNGAKLFDLGGTLGHSNLKTTMRYAHHDPEAHKNVIQLARRKHRAS